MFKKKKKRIQQDVEILALQHFKTLCNDGFIKDRVFVLPKKNILIFADVISLKSNVAQVIYQLHYDGLVDPVIENIAALGKNEEDALVQACKGFFRLVLHVFLEAIRHPISNDQEADKNKVGAFFNIYRSDVGGIGERSELNDHDLWDLIKDNIFEMIQEYQPVTWVKMIVSRQHEKIQADVRVNGIELKSLSEVLLHYAEEWSDCEAYHSEKQGVLITYSQPFETASNTNGSALIHYAISLYEQPAQLLDQKTIYKTLLAKNANEVLVGQIVGLLPEIYCMYAYPNVVFGTKIFLYDVDQGVREIPGEFMGSLKLMQEIVALHLHENGIKNETLKQILLFSSSAKAIEKAFLDGNREDELVLSGIGYQKLK